MEEVDGPGDAEAWEEDEWVGNRISISEKTKNGTIPILFSRGDALRRVAPSRPGPAPPARGPDQPGCHRGAGGGARAPVLRARPGLEPDARVRGAGVDRPLLDLGRGRRAGRGQGGRRTHVVVGGREREQQERVGGLLQVKMNCQES